MNRPILPNSPHSNAVVLHPVGEFWFPEPSSGQGNIYFFGLAKAPLTQWVYLDLHQQYPWPKSCGAVKADQTLEVGEDSAGAADANPLPFLAPICPLMWGLPILPNPTSLLAPAGSCLGWWVSSVHCHVELATCSFCQRQNFYLFPRSLYQKFSID